MSSTNGTGASVTLNIKGPSALKLSISISTENTVLQLKQRIEAENKDFPAERCVHVEMAYTPSQRLIYSGKVLKDSETLESYNVKDNRMSFTMNPSNLRRRYDSHGSRCHQVVWTVEYNASLVDIFERVCYSCRRVARCTCWFLRWSAIYEQPSLGVESS